MRTYGGDNFYTNPHFIFCCPLFRLLFLFLPYISLPFLFSPKTPFVVEFFSRDRRVFRVNPDMFHHRTFLLRTKDSKWRLVRRSFFLSYKAFPLCRISRVCTRREKTRPTRKTNPFVSELGLRQTNGKF